MKLKNHNKKRAGRILRELILTVTNRCNHACFMCYYHKSINRNIKPLTGAELEKISLSLGKLDLLMIAGGEPFLRRDLPSICKIFSENNNIRSLFIPTNGSLPKIITSGVSHILEILPRIRLNIMFSLEGCRNIHDRIHGKRGAFNLVLKTMEELHLLRFKLLKKKRFFGISLNTVVADKNADEVMPLMDYVKKNIWVDSHTFSPMRGAGRNPNYRPPGGRVFEKLFHEAKPYFRFYASRSLFSKEKQRGAVRRLDDRYRLWIHLLNGGRLPFGCRAGNSIGVLEPDGGVRPCELRPVIGNVRDAGYDFGKVWRSEKAGRIGKTIPDCTCTHACFINAGEEH